MISNNYEKMKIEDDLYFFGKTRMKNSKKWKTTSTKMEDNLNKMEDDLIKNGRRPKKIRLKTT
jgi:hypothetical protein